MLKAVLITAFVASPALKPALAQAVGVDMPWPAQLGVSGMLGLLLWHQNKGHNEAIKKVGDDMRAMGSGIQTEISGMRQDAKVAADRQIDLLTDCLVQQQQRKP